MFLFITLYHNDASHCLCYNMFMDLANISDVVTTLENRLESIETADTLIDALEGQLPHARKAAVLLILFEYEGATTILFIRRASTLRAHRGEIAFPGGGVDATDSSVIMAALREAQEEIGLEPDRVEVLGLLHPVFTVVSNYLIIPVVAYLPQGLGTLQLQAAEVTEIILASLPGLTDPSVTHFHTERWSRDGRTRIVYFYDYGQYRIWGATARILNGLLEVLQ